jgi:hypothetical protein
MGKTYLEYSYQQSEEKRGKSTGKKKRMKYGIAKETEKRESAAATQR